MANSEDEFNLEDILKENGIIMDDEQSENEETTSNISIKSEKRSIISNASSSSSCEVSKSKRLTKEDTDYIYEKACDAKYKLKDKEKTHFSVTIPEIVHTNKPHTNASPLNLSAYNASYSFQHTSKNVDAAPTSNPFRLPIEVQNNIRLIGANMEKLKRLKERDRIPTSSIDSSSSKTSCHSSVKTASVSVVEVKKEEKYTQTSTNTGDLFIILSSDDLMGLSKEKKEALINFMKVCTSMLKFLNKWLFV